METGIIKTVFVDDNRVMVYRKPNDETRLFGAVDYRTYDIAITEAVSDDTVTAAWREFVAGLQNG